MKIIRNILIIILVIIAIVYHGQTIKAQRVKDVRLRYKLQEGKITKDQYEQFKQQNTYLNTFLNPKEVLSVD
ncbi:MAG: hypothetical protein ABIG46_04995 [Candidatus Omnitrophota bacterium]|nr:hypothetical protein [Candidatus Omnitrophota bacterium]